MSMTNQKTESKINVLKPNYLKMTPGGLYDLNEANYCERAVVKIHLLQQLLEIASERICCNGEIDGMVLDTEITALADKAFELYAPFIQDGVDIFEYSDYTDPKTLERYLKRPRVLGQMNAGPDEGVEGIPAGWWFDFPGFANKTFDIGQMVVDMDGEYRFWVYAPGTWEDGQDPIDTVEIQDEHELDKLRDKWPALADELTQIFFFIKKTYAE